MSAACTSCHSMQRIVRSTHDTEEFMQTMARMQGYSAGAVPSVPVRRVATREVVNPERFRKTAEYLSTINLSSTSTWEYPLKTLPRLTGRSTHVLITEYDLPRRAAQPHDVILGPDGMVYYSDFGAQVMGRLDPKTGKVTEFQVPELKHGFPPGSLDIEADKDGNLWLGMMLQGGLARFDPKTEKFQMFALPAKINSDVAQQAMVVPAYNIDGKVWMNNVGFQGVHRMDLASGQFDTYALNNNPNSATAGAGGMDGGSGHSPYGIAGDSKNNIYVMDFASTNIGKVDAKTGKLTYFPTPTPNSHPRRGHMDAQDRLWFAEYGVNKMAMFDTRTEKFQEWDLPTPWTAPYDVVQDKNGELWTGGMNSDRIVRLNPKNNQSVEYQLPKDTNIRRVFVDNSTSPVTFWTGSNHGGSIVKLEPLD
jgi:virginiamycin B lyase